MTAGRRPGAPALRGALAVAAIVALLASCRDVRRTAATPAASPAPIAGSRAPAGVRIQVEVLNGTRTPGLARRATQYLRALGYDVVLIGTSGARQAHTIVLDRSGHPAWARALATAMRARSEARPDTSRYVDATVVLGADWAPPALPLDP